MNYYWNLKDYHQNIKFHFSLMKQELVSIIIRTKNEERWISQCLESINKQTYKNFEVILVDNNSKDKTVDKAKHNKVKKILKIKNFLPGKAINLGAKNSKGKYIVCISAHCIPKNKKWLENLVKCINSDDKIAGVYGRQEAMSYSKPEDKRDLLLIFGLDKKIQRKDNFFHNANSIIRKDLWNKIPFDNNTTNIEDRLWGKKVLAKGFKIVYEPEASVLHFHGIHQTGNTNRIKKVINVIERTENKFNLNFLDVKKMNIIAIIPTIGEPKYINKKPLISYTINFLKQSKFIKKIIVSTDNLKMKKIAIKLGAECPFIRKKNLSSNRTNLEKVVKYTLDQLERKKIFPDLIFQSLETFPFKKNSKIIDQMIMQLVKKGYDSVIAVKEQSSWLWHENEDNSFVRIDSGDVRRKFKRKSYTGLNGFGFITHSEFIRNMNTLGNNIGFYKVNDQMCNFEITDKNSFDLAEYLLKKSIKNLEN